MHPLSYLRRAGNAHSGASAVTPPGIEDQREAKGLVITVVFTTVSATLLALKQAAEFGRSLGARIRILVPHAVPYPLPLDRPQVDPGIRLRRFRTIVLDAAVETWLDVRLCRDTQHCILQDLCPSSLVLIGGRKRWCWCTREERLAKKLSFAGHHVLFIPEKG